MHLSIRMQCIQYTPYTARKATNKIIKVEVGRSPYISWELLKARLIVKKAVLCMAGPGGSRHALLQGMPALCDAAANQVDSESFHSINNDKATHKWDTDVVRLPVPWHADVLLALPAAEAPLPLPAPEADSQHNIGVATTTAYSSDASGAVSR